jgi:hypothetical protein
MTPVEQHLEDYEAALLSLAVALAQQHSSHTVKPLEKVLKIARKKLADHIALCQTAHTHSQYELRTHGLP